MVRPDADSKIHFPSLPISTLHTASALYTPLLHLLLSLWVFFFSVPNDKRFHGRSVLPRSLECRSTFLFLGPALQIRALPIMRESHVFCDEDEEHFASKNGRLRCRTDAERGDTFASVSLTGVQEPEMTRLEDAGERYGW